MTIKDYKDTTTRMERRKLQSKKSSWKKFLLVFIVILVVCTGLFAFFLYDFFFINKNDLQFDIFKLVNKGKKETIPFTKLNILIIGFDSEVNGNPRSDTLMLASFDIKEKAVGILSIPRDTRVLIPGKESHSKINSAFAEGGPEKAVKTVSAFLGIPVHYYISTNFDGFAAMIDTLGGVEINVKEDMYYKDEAGGLLIDLKKGKQVLNGEQAIGYVRYRDDITADLGRIQRQQDFINQAINQFLTPELIIKFPTLLSQFNKSIKTDMSVKDMMNLGKLVKDIKREDIKTATIPGTSEYVDNISYFLHDEVGTRALVHDLIASKEYVANSKYKVAVFNGSGIFRAAGKVSENLELHGYNIGKIANADNYNYEKTQVYYTKKLTEEIKGLAELLNGEIKTFEDSVYANEESLINFDALVIVGKDFENTKE